MSTKLRANLLTFLVAPACLNFSSFLSIFFGVSGVMKPELFSWGFFFRATEARKGQGVLWLSLLTIFCGFFLFLAVGSDGGC